MAIWSRRALALSTVIAAGALQTLAVTPAPKPDKKDKPQAAAKPAAPPDVVALVDGAPITAAQVEERAAAQLAQLRQQEHEIRERTIESLINDELVKNAAAKVGLGATEYLRAELDNKIAPVTEEDKQKVYEQYKARLQNMPQEEAMKQVEAFLRRQRTDERRAALLGELRAQAKVRMLLEPPRKEVAAIGPSKGKADAPVTIVEFSDFECPFCSRVNESLKQVMERYGNQVRVVFRDFPLGMHANAPKAAEAGGCADEQGKFWEMHDKLFADQKKLDVASLKQSAQELGLDTAKFNECLDSGKLAQDVQKDMEDGTKAGVSGTPAFFINGRFLSGAAPLEQFTRLIDDELSRKDLPIPPPPAPKAAAAAPSAQ